MLYYYCSVRLDLCSKYPGQADFRYCPDVCPKKACEKEGGVCIESDPRVIANEFHVKSKSAYTFRTQQQSTVAVTHAGSTFYCVLCCTQQASVLTHVLPTARTHAMTGAARASTRTTSSAKSASLRRRTTRTRMTRTRMTRRSCARATRSAAAATRALEVLA
eukprot:15435-Heterococcus_DN1.PRE.4